MGILHVVLVWFTAGESSLADMLHLLTNPTIIVIAVVQIV